MPKNALKFYKTPFMQPFSMREKPTFFGSHANYSLHFLEKAPIYVLTI